MRDSDRPALIPLENLAAVAGYEDLWTSADWARFDQVPVKLVIARFADRIGDILDIESTLATAAQAPGWCDRFNRPGRRRPTLYHSRGLRGPVLAAMAGRPYDWWAATLDGTKDVLGAVAVQYWDFGGYDESVILDPTWLGLPKEVSMVIYKTATQITGTLVAEGLVIDLAHTEDVVAHQSAGVPIITVTQDFMDRLHAAAAAVTGSVSGQLTVTGQLAVR